MAIATASKAMQLMRCIIERESKPILKKVDRRNNKNKRYPLPLLLLIAFCASISKHDSWYTMQDYALAHEASIRELYKQLLGEELEHVTPSHDTLKIVPSKSHSPQGLQGGLSKLDCGSPTVG